MVVALDGPPDFDPALAHKAAADGLALLQAFIADDRLAASRLVLLTRRAIATQPDEGVLDLAHAALWGLARTAQSENPDRLLFLVDSDGSEASWHALAAVLNANERQCALRNGQCLVPRLGRQSKDVLGLPDAPGWRLHSATKGSFDGLAFIPHPEARSPLAAGQVRIAVQAAGLNFHDILDSLGMLPGDDAPLGGEGAGIVTEVGPGVQEFAVGDRVMGLFAAAFGPVAIADARLITLMPKAWSFAQGASVPITFLTAFYGLVDLAGLKAGERVLIHAAAGGVGTAAVQLARHLGAEVFATASTGKWHALQARGFDDAHLSSSRDLDFERHFLRSTGQAGMDVVLDCLAGDFVDASRVCYRGGRFLEMGKTDIRDAGEVAAAHPGVVYQAYDLREATPERLQEMLHALSVLFERGVLHPPPITCWDIRRAPQAFRALGRAQHIGKHVLTLPPSLDPQGTVLITGGTGTLGGLVARHLVTAHGVKHLLLISRQGPAAAGAEALRHELETAGAEVTIVGCDASDREALRLLLEAIPAAQPLTAVFHAAGTLDDGMLPALTPERLDKVLAPKLDAAWHLHELTRDQDLAAFVLFSSLSGLFGAAGQANYAAANAFLDALSHHRQAHGLAASSLAWGYWSQASGLTGRLQAADIARMRRGGLLPLSSEQGLTLLDAALERSEALVVPARFDLGVIAALGELPALLRSLVHTRRTATNTAASSFAQRLLALPQSEREHALLDLVRREAATVLALTSPSELEIDRPLVEIGLDSLMAVEIRNRLAAAIGQKLPATLLFNHPTAAALSRYLTTLFTGRASVPQPVPLVAPASDDEPVAIVAMGCRFPGGVRTPEELWSLLCEGGDAISGFPDNRGWDLGGLDGQAAQAGGFVHDADRFDPAFFGISPREALAIDPQQRLLLEVSWEALERAGVDPASLQGSQSGVFLGIYGNDYLTRLSPDSLEAVRTHLATGTATSVASGRIAYTLGLHGPAVSLDTACSSSLVALHMAAQALRRGECSLALAGGVTVMATPATFAVMGTDSAGAADGRCKAFSAAADGAGWSEGAGMLVLERLSDARRNGHPVLALLRGSAINQDGRSQGLSAPNGPAQERVIRQALASAGLAPRDIDAVEAHGTGTTLGDPIEAQALLATYGEAHGPERPLWLGSLKSNIGHAQAAAGVGGVIKMVLALQNGVLPRTLHAENPSAHIDWSSGTVRLLTEAVPWTAGGRPRRAGVSSFGISGTNAHVILEEAPTLEEAATAEQPEAQPSAPALAAWPLLLSARSEAALKGQAERLRAHVLAHPELSLVDLAYSLATTRSAFEHRAAILADSDAGLVTALDAIARGDSAPATTLGRAGGGGKVVFVFPGQGSQWQGMALSLLDTSPVFRARLEACEAALAPHVDWSLLSVLHSEDESLTPRSHRCSPSRRCSPWRLPFSVLARHWPQTRSVARSQPSANSPPPTWPACCRFAIACALVRR